MKKIHALIVLSIATVALAQAPTAPASENPITAALLQSIVAIIGTLTATLLAYANQALRQYVKRVKSKRLRELLELVDELAFKKVLEMTQTVTGVLRAYSADGRLTVEEMHATARTAATELYEDLPHDVREALIKQYGSGAAVLNTLIQSAIETAVQAAPKPAPQLRALNVTGGTVVEAQSAVSPERVREARRRIGL